MVTKISKEKDFLKIASHTVKDIMNGVNSPFMEYESLTDKFIVKEGVDYQLHRKQKADGVPRSFVSYVADAVARAIYKHIEEKSTESFSTDEVK